MLEAKASDEQTPETESEENTRWTERHHRGSNNGTTSRGSKPQRAKHKGGGEAGKKTETSPAPRSDPHLTLFSFLSFLSFPTILSATLSMSSNLSACIVCIL